MKIDFPVICSVGEDEEEEEDVEKTLCIAIK